MGPEKIKFKDIDEYISFHPSKVKKLLKELRSTIKIAAPDAEELISYNMPALKFHGLLLYFAAHKEHIGFYPGNSSTIELFKKELTAYKTSKGTIQFSLEEKIPVTLVKKIVKLRVEQNLERAKQKKKK